MQPQEDQVLAAIRKNEPKKKRVNFFISEVAKKALARWCEKNDVSESSAIEHMIRATVPDRYFEERR